jgi:hypothetical protein
VNLVQEEIKEAPKTQQEADDDSMSFIPDPDFLMKINQNMLNNDKNFNKMG